MRPFRGTVTQCINCGAKIRISQSNAKRGKGIYCSTSCRTRTEILEKNPAWKGGRRMANGYWKITLPGIGTVYEHRHVMEQKLGRKLLRYEQVYHRNGIRHDNTPENLSLMPPKRVDWAKPEEKAKA